MQNFEGNRGTMTKFGNKEHRKTNLRFLETRGASQFIPGNKGTGTPLGGSQ